MHAFFTVKTIGAGIFVLEVGGLVSPKLSCAHIRPVFGQSVLECTGRWRVDYMLWQCIPTVDHCHAEE